MPTALLTGATGFFGHHVAAALIAEGWTVRALARDRARGRPPGPWNPAVEKVGGDLSEATDLSAAAAGCEAIVHVAGVVKARRLRDYREVNAAGTERLVRAAQQSAPAALFVLVSSQAAAGPARSGRPVREEDPPRPVSWYGISKREGELAVERGWRGPWIVLRPGVLYGPGDRGLLTYFEMAAAGWVPVPARRSYIQVGSVEQAATAVARAASRKNLAGRTGFLCDPEPVGIGDLAAEIARLPSRPARLFGVPHAFVRGAALLETARESLTGRSRPFNADKARELLAGDWLCDPLPMRRDLGLPPPLPLAEGLRRTWDWYLQTGWIRDRRAPGAPRGG
ncbi:MAG: NAD-dependent epimerase/dehydratase family protein [Thermoanaerobaculia bacterium]